MITVETILPLVKQSMRIKSVAFDETQLPHLIKAAQMDLCIAGVEIPPEYDELVAQALATYCIMNFGVVDEYDRFKKSYDEQKAQLSNASGYTDWGDSNV